MAQLAPPTAMSNAEKCKQYRKRKRDIEMMKYFASMPCSSDMTDAQKTLVYKRMKKEQRKTNKQNIEQGKLNTETLKVEIVKPMSNAEKCKQYREKKKLKTKPVDSVISKRELKKKQDAQRSKKYRMRKKIELAMKRATEIVNYSKEADAVVRKCDKTQLIAPDFEITKRFGENKFGFTCSVCDRLWSEDDLRSPPKKCVNILRNEFPGENVTEFKVCSTCYSSLEKKKIPNMSRSIVRLNLNQIPAEQMEYVFSKKKIQKLFACVDRSQSMEI